MRVLIVDDEPPARDKLRRWLAEQPDLNVIAEIGDGVSAVQCIGAMSPDVVFLDIQMPGMTGLEIAAQLQATTAPLFVFVTAFGDHALQAFDLNAIDYLLKPYDKERLLRTLDRVRERIPNKALHARAIQLARQQVGASGRLLVADGDKLVPIERDSIRWMEADDNYVHIRCGDRRYIVRRTLQDLLAQLGESQFARIHKSTAVNIAAIASLNPLFKGDYEILMNGGEKLRLSRRYKDALFARLGK